MLYSQIYGQDSVRNYSLFFSKRGVPNTWGVFLSFSWTQLFWYKRQGLVVKDKAAQEKKVLRQQLEGMPISLVPKPLSASLLTIGISRDVAFLFPALSLLILRISSNYVLAIPLLFLHTEDPPTVPVVLRHQQLYCTFYCRIKEAAIEITLFVAHFWRNNEHDNPKKTISMSFCSFLTAFVLNFIKNLSTTFEIAQSKTCVASLDSLSTGDVGQLCFFSL